MHPGLGLLGKVCLYSRAFARESWPGRLSYDLRTFCYESLRFLIACFPCMLILDELADRRQRCHPQFERSRLLLLLMPKSLGRDPLERSLRVMTFPRTSRRSCMFDRLIAGRVPICLGPSDPVNTAPRLALDSLGESFAPNADSHPCLYAAYFNSAPRQRHSCV